MQSSVPATLPLSSTHISCFPSTVLTAIFRNMCVSEPVFLPLKRVDPRYILALVCTTWAKIVQNLPSLWDKVYFQAEDDTLHPPFPLLNQFSLCVHRSRNNPLNIAFDTVFAGWDFNFVRLVIMPHINRIQKLRFPIVGDANITEFLSIDEGHLDALEFLDIYFANTRDFPTSNIPFGLFRQFGALRTAPKLRTVVLRLWNSFSPLDIPLPYRQLTSIDLGSSPLTPDILLHILHLCTSIRLEEAFFQVQFIEPRPTYKPKLPSAVTMQALRNLRLRLLDPSNDPRFFSLIHFPSLEYLWIEMSNAFQQWDLSLFTAFLDSSSTSLHELQMSDFARYAFDAEPLYQGNENSNILRARQHWDINGDVDDIEALFVMLPNLERLYLPVGIHIHTEILEKLSSCALLPRLRLLELGSDSSSFQILEMVKRRHLYVLDVLLERAFGQNNIPTEIGNLSSMHTGLISSLEHLDMHVPMSNPTEKTMLVRTAQDLANKFGLRIYIHGTPILPLSII
ncbi:hypothetical protein BDN70DRAFT_937390 [Pholiota conissans]|uniref:F-box domain-containing protein n=1 Tax=Pholiota conissans TaxID=109636 RepID=A0A9P5YTI9_9AGAR|nr:hypothetical protein BDN70DRAFT_937390 [Pholiota conissans]